MSSAILRDFRSWVRIGAASALLSALTACQTVTPYDYSNFRAHPPRSILVLPPVNDTTAVEGTYGYLSTVSQPLGELGYYVFPVAVLDSYLKDNGLPTPTEMQQVALGKFAEITGADAVLYVTLKQYGTKYVVLNSVTSVEVDARLLDTRTGILLWSGHALAQQGASNSSGGVLGALVAAAVTQIINSSTDRAHQVSHLANQLLLDKPGAALPYGPYSPLYGKPR